MIISAIAALERDLIAERVKNGLKNAREKGKLLGRAKKRDSILIRKLLDAGLSYRNVAKIAKCSHGSVHAEVVQYKRDKALKKSMTESAIKENEITKELITTTTTELENKDESSKMAFPQVA